ncbi:MAG: hypothetical protein ACLFPF_06450 [Halanaerobiales bacterium]
MLYQYVIKILMSNSDTVFTALVMGVLGYIGWLCWKINEREKEFMKKWKEEDMKLNLIKKKFDQFDQGIYKDILGHLNENIKDTDKLLLVSQDNNNEIERVRNDIITEVKDSAAELKDIIMILMNNRTRNIKNYKEGLNNISNEMGKIHDSKYNKD